ncbi:MAG: hypothetical protein GX605_02980 [Chloroflexi bacterium]|nr:hypothetical protein [Chloroflexota bacterium]
MNGGRLALLALTLLGAAAGCGGQRGMDKIIQVVYTADSGPVIPEMQWHERITISRDKVTLMRNGRADRTLVNAGAWEWTADQESAAALFAQLQAVDCPAIRRIEPEDSPDGGGATTYTVIRSKGRPCTLTYDPGATYAGGQQIVEPVRAFILGLALPAEAGSRYR